MVSEKKKIKIPNVLKIFPKLFECLKCHDRSPCLRINLSQNFRLQRAGSPLFPWVYYSKVPNAIHPPFTIWAKAYAHINLNQSKYKMASMRHDAPNLECNKITQCFSYEISSISYQLQRGVKLFMFFLFLFDKWNC